MPYLDSPAVRAHRHLGHAVRGGHGGHPRRDEPVHLAVQPHLAQHRRAECLQAAAQILEAQAGDAPDQAVGQHRRELAQCEAVLPVLAPAGHQVVRFVEQLVDQQRDVPRVVLQVAVHGDDDIATRRVDTRLHGRRLPEIAQQAKHPDVRAHRGGMRLQRGAGAVAAAVVDDDQLPGVRIRGQRSMHRVDQRLRVVDLVVHRHHHRQAVRRQADQGQGPGGFDLGHHVHRVLSSIAAGRRAQGRIIAADSKATARLKACRASAPAATCAVAPPSTRVAAQTPAS